MCEKSQKQPTSGCGGRRKQDAEASGKKGGGVRDGRTRTGQEKGREGDRPNGSVRTILFHPEVPESQCVSIKLQSEK